MRCPYCKGDNDRVIDSRANQDGFVIRRRRECLDCNRRYTTYERVEEATIKIVKKDGTRVPYEREKLKSGIEKACWKRPISDDTIESILVTVENRIHATFENEVNSKQLGEMVMDQLRQADHVAFVRFASVYREFKDVSDFVDELRLLRQTDEQ